jgi:hypothetical protein
MNMLEIDREHPKFTHHVRTLRMYRDLYAGGFEFKLRAAHYLQQRQKEPRDIYAERLQRVFYENYIGSIVDWYTATLFRREPSLQFEGGLESDRSFLVEFIQDCDLRGTKLSYFFKGCLTEALVTGESHVLIDFPLATQQARNRAEEDAIGLSRAFLVRYSAEELINWSCDDRGDYDWVVLRTEAERQLSVDSPEIVKETRWTYYDKSEYRIYRRVQRTDGTGDILMVDRGPHAMARQNRVPLVSLRLNDGLWLLNKAAHLQLEHFNKSNSLGWAITMGLFAMPVIYSDREWNQIVGESYYIQLGASDRFGWTEPDGKVYQIAADNLEVLKEEIYRVCYLSQVSGQGLTGRAQSALSMQIEFTVTQEVLRAYAGIVKECIGKVLSSISEARQDGVQLYVAGMDEMDINDFGTDLDQASKLLQLNIQSPALRKQIFQRLALKYLSDARQDTKDQIAQEIDAQTI